MGRLKIIYFVYYLFLLTVSNVSYSQSKNFDVLPEEELIAIINSNLFVAGESLYYKLNCINKKTNSFSRISKIAHVILVNDANKIVFNQKVILDNGIGFGDYYIPSNIKTGNYKLVYYTNWMNQNKRVPIYYSDIYIVSPFSKNTSNLKTRNSVDSIAKFTEFNLQKNKTNSVLLNSDATSYRTRSKVTLTIENIKENIGFNNYTLSVRKLDSIIIIKERKRNKITPNNEKFYLPEIRGEIISGKIISKESSELIANKIVTLSIKENPNIYKNFKTNEFGKFYFSLYENYNSNDLILQVIDDDNEKYQIILDNSIPSFIKELPFSEIVLNPNIKNWLVNKSINNQIENAFFQSKKDSIINKKEPKIFYGKPSLVYVLDDFTRFKTVKETFIEVVKRVVVRKRKGNNRIVLYTSNTILDKQIDELNSLILIDGVLIQNHNLLLDYNPALIEKIEIVFDKYFFGSSIYDGILSVKTKKGNFSLPYSAPHLKKEIVSPISRKIYYSPNYSTDFETLKRIPDNRTQLVWYAEMKLTKGSTKFNFYTSDITGLFEIRLTGINEENEFIEIKKYITVK